MNIKHSGFWLVTVLILFLIYLAVVQFMLVLYEGYFSGHLYNWKSFHIVDEKTGWALEPGAKGYVPTHNGLIETIINSSGLRDDEYPLEKNKDISRIMFLGDSFLYDNAFRHQETYHYMTEFRLKRWGYKSEIINASANGYGTGQEYLYYAIKGKLSSLIYVFCIYMWETT
ncbi:MAG TPA: hypothetical protein ENI77_00505 [Nitrospirae bacterium]|nr:hypothetical protein [Nitrospirota bacterium]